MRQAGHQVESERQRTSCECCSWAAVGMLALVVHIESWSALSLAGLPWVSPSPAHVTTRLSDGAQKTSSPASWGQAKGPDSAPEQDSSLTAGATSPQPPPLHLALPLLPEKPIDLQITPAVPELTPLLQIGDHELSMKISGRPAPSMDGEPSGAINRTAPCGALARADPVQYTTVSCACPMHASSGIDHAHSSGELGEGVG
jgi:hypothetical protein